MTTLNLSIFEAIMLICFGASWPFALKKTYTTKSTKGKSARFLILIIVGYLAGIIHKILYSFDGVIFLYILNLIMVTSDLIMYFKYKNLPQNK
ncbi:MAG: hypothetical protein E7Z91_06795 [Cyanobacteria bacterium SIG30]|nr:hypothetical protein [Cyanobacteria bacterium SIG30]